MAKMLSLDQIAALLNSLNEYLKGTISNRISSTKLKMLVELMVTTKSQYLNLNLLTDTGGKKLSNLQPADLKIFDAILKDLSCNGANCKLSENNFFIVFENRNLGQPSKKLTLVVN